ncbi:hypothetical protein [Methylomonas sp. HYX-M1]|uniref:head-tail joining protein n=1 Tax=Methylomonas sp. HYX-M1 TaxID=3139307 RepID=UPI00345BA6B9
MSEENVVNDMALEAFGEPFIYRDGAIAHELRGIFTDHTRAAAIAGQAFADKTYSLELPKANLDSAGVVLRGVVMVGEAEYSILDWQTDHTGWSVLTLRAYA